MSNYSNAALALAERRITRIPGPRLPHEDRPQNLDQAFAVQTEISAILAERTGDTIAGWKCLLPPEGKIVVGPIYKSCVWQEGECTLQSLNGKAGIEPEFAFVFGKTLAPQQAPFTNETVAAAVAEIRLAFELIKCRYTEPDECEFPEILADSMFNQGLMLGPALAQTPAPNSCPIELEYGETFETFAGVHPNQDVFAPVVWLANFLASKGQAIEAGQAVITGSYAGVLNVPDATPITVRYQGLGEIKAQFKFF